MFTNRVCLWTDIFRSSKSGLFFFRAEILTGGMVIEELSSDPPCCRLNYLTRADLKGNKGCSAA